MIKACESVLLTKRMTECMIERGRVINEISLKCARDPNFIFSNNYAQLCEREKQLLQEYESLATFPAKAL